MPKSKRYLIGEDVPVKKLRQIAQTEGFELFPNDRSPFLKSVKSSQKYPRPLTLVSDNFTNQSLEKILTLPVSRIVDAQALDDSIHDFLERSETTELKERCSFLLTCPVIYNCDVSKIFIESLKKRIGLSDAQTVGIHMALHEAIVNGLVHGNLDISSEYRQSARSFIEYGRILSERLNNPEYARKSIYISAEWDRTKVVIKIRDEGAGYAVKDNFASRTVSPKTKTGRGLLFIAGIADSCTIDDYGRKINLTFSLKDDYTESENTYVKNRDVEEDDKQDETQDSNYSRPSISECRVLIVEDNLSNQTMLYRLLNVIGITLVECATDGIEGLKKVTQFRPDLIILDITMPRMNGYDVLHHLKSSPETRDIPVLIETASDTREARDKTFRQGATDFITKPINPLEFFSRIKVHLENRMLIKRLEKQLKQVNEELNSAQRMQRTLLPSDTMLKNVEEEYGLQIAHHFEPSSRLGGDFWEVIPLSLTKIAIYICDFSGHGVSAALNTFRLHALINQMDRLNVEVPSSAMMIMNAQLLNLLPRGQFATFFLGVLDLEKNRIIYSSAGVPKPFLIHKGKINMLNSDGMPLGISKQAQYHNSQVSFEKGDELILYSDALTESPNKDGERMGEIGFSKLVENCRKDNDASEMVGMIMDDFFKFAPPPPPDDVTLVYLKRAR